MLILICDYCQQPIDGAHYALTVERRVPVHFGTGLASIPVSQSPSVAAQADKARIYVVHTFHFDDDPGGLSAALRDNFNAPEPEPEPEPTPTPVEIPPTPMTVVGAVEVSGVPSLPDVLDVRVTEPIPQSPPADPTPPPADPTPTDPQEPTA